MRASSPRHSSSINENSLDVSNAQFLKFASQYLVRNAKSAAFWNGGLISDPPLWLYECLLAAIRGLPLP